MVIAGCLAEAAVVVVDVVLVEQAVVVVVRTRVLISPQALPGVFSVLVSLIFSAFTPSKCLIVS